MAAERRWWSGRPTAAADKWLFVKERRPRAGPCERKATAESGEADLHEKNTGGHTNTHTHTHSNSKQKVPSGPPGSPKKREKKKRLQQIFGSVTQTLP